MKNFTKIFLGTFLVLAITVQTADAYTWSRSLKLGSRGSDVKDLQMFLNMCADTKVSNSGAGSPGMETTYFGPATKAAVIKFQTARGVSPQSGLFGPLSRAKAADLQASSNVCGGVVVNPPQGQNGPVMASLSATTPAAGYIVNNQATAGLLDVTFSGNGMVNSVTLKRSGISDQNTLSNVYLYEGNTRLTDGYSFNSAGEITMNNLGIMVNGSKVISVKADASSTASNNSTIAVALTSFASGASVNAVNIQGNTMNLASGSSLATASFSANTVIGTPTVNAGVSSYTFWSAPVQVNTRALHLKSAAFRMIGSAPSDALSNIKLFVNGVDTGKVAMVAPIQGTNYAIFDFGSSPLSLSTGTSTISVQADIVKGSSRTVSFSLQQAADLMVMDPQVGVNVAVSGTIPNNAGTITIGTGSVTASVDTTFQSMTNVTGGSSNAVIGKYKVRAYGEDVKVNSLAVTPVLTLPSTTYTSGTVTVGSQAVTVASTTGFKVGHVITIAGATQAVGTVTAITSGTVMQVNITTGGVTPAGAVTVQATGLQNVTVYFNGSQVGTQTASWTSGAITLNLGSQMIIPAGVDSLIEVRADLRSTTGVNHLGGSVSADLTAGTSNAQGQSSYTTVNFPGSLVTGSILSVQTGLLGLALNGGYASQNLSPNLTNAKIGSFVFQNQSSSESVRVTSLQVALGTTGNQTTVPVLANYASLKTSENASPVQPQATNTFSVDFVLAPGATKIVDVFADIGSTSGGTIVATLTATSIGVSSNVSTTSSAVTGQTITVASGTVTNPPTFTASASASAQYIAAAGGATNATVARYNFQSSGGSSRISELKFTTTGTANAITSVSINGVTAPVIGTLAWFNTLALDVPQGGSGLNVDVMITYSNVGLSGVASGSTAGLNLTEVKYTSGGTTATFAPTVVSNTMTLVGSRPSLALGLPNGATGSSVTGLSVGTKYVADVRVTADSKGDIKIDTLPLTFTGNAAGTTANGAAVVVKNSSGSTITAVTLSGTAAGQNATATINFTGGYTISAGQTETFKIEIPVTAVSGTGASLATGLGAAASFTWTDVAGNGSTAAAAGTLILNYPTSSVSMTN